ncbi:phage tail protein [Pseudomonas sp. K1(2024)]|uniref:Phage tail protein n=1 Tax=Pseudomonas boreofloridensis TaxID=3064348 RepID=A0ABV4Z2V9_9PSED|nr:phage tail protein [Pseudomonas sp. K13]MDO7900620.1 phage tail protein [Pseudomonas sp. K13]
MVDQNSQFYAILTNVGAAKQANADALGISWKITQMGVGDANGTDPTPNATQTRLLNEWRRAPLNQLSVDEKDKAVIVAEQVIPADVGGRWIREIGLYDADGDLIAIANCAPTYKPLLSQGSGRTQVVRMSLIVSSASNVQLKIDPSVVLATREYVDSLILKVLPPNKVAGRYTRVTINERGVVQFGDNPTTLDGYGITDALKRGEVGLGVSAILAGEIDHIGQPGGFYAFGEGPTSFANYSAVVNIPYIDERYGAQIGLVFGGEGSEPKLAFRVTDRFNAWGPTRFAWHNGNFDPATKADLGNTYTKAQVDSIASKKANNAVTLGGYGITDAYTVTETNNLLAAKAAKATTLAGYGITDGLRRGEVGLGAKEILAGEIDHFSQPGGFYAYGEGPTSFANYSAVVNLPYIDERYGAQIGLVFGGAGGEPKLAFRVTNGAYQWGVTRFAWHNGNFDPATKADLGNTYTKAQVDAIASKKANNAITLGGYGITDAYTAAQTDNLLAAKANKSTSLAGYGITDGLKRGEVGLGVPVLAGSSSVDMTTLNSGFHAFGDGPTSLLGYSSVLNLPYLTNGFAAQIAVSQGRADVDVRVRSCSASGVWTPTRRLMHDGHLASIDEVLQGVDDTKWLNSARLVAKLVDGFAVSLAQNGYIILPRWLGGLTLQWGRANQIPPGGAAVSLNIAMPRAIFTAIASSIGNVNGSQHEVVEVAEVSTTKLTLSNSGTGSVSWFAIGY